MKTFFKQNIKFILGIFLGLIISGVGVYALTVTAGQVAYDNTTSGLTSTNVKDAIDELYDKAENAGPSCAVKLGDYISLTPTKTSFTIKTSPTGYTSTQTINPSELNLWRVIDIHSDGSFDAVSEYVSSTNVYFQGTTGYANFVGVLNTIAAQYQVPGKTIGSRHMGYGGQTSMIWDTSAFDGTSTTAPSTNITPDLTSGTGQEYVGGAAGDTLYLKDYLLVKNIYGNVIADKVGTTTATTYWIASRKFYYYVANDYNFYGRCVFASGNLGGENYFRTRGSNGWQNFSSKAAVRPILTLKSGITTSGGSGSKTDPYTLS